MTPIATTDLYPSPLSSPEPEPNLKIFKRADISAPTDLLVPVLFGGDDTWIYDPNSKRFDLSRGSAAKLIIDADDGVRDHRGCIIDPESTILLVVDMQNFLIHPRCCDRVEGLAAVAPTLKVIERCRQDGIQVVWLNWGIDEWNLRRMPPAVQRGFCRRRALATGHG